MESIPSHPSLAVMMQKKQPKMDLVKYVLAACYSPVESTYIKAIMNNHFSSWL